MVSNYGKIKSSSSTHGQSNQTALSLTIGYDRNNHSPSKRMKGSKHSHNHHSHGGSNGKSSSTGNNSSAKSKGSGGGGGGGHDRSDSSLGSINQTPDHDAKTTRVINPGTVPIIALMPFTYLNSILGVYTCATCNALFTCLEYYQQHRRLHSESNGVKLLTCCHCPYSTDNQFHYNWHIMSHTGEPPHRCSVCDKSDDEEDEDEDGALASGSPNDSQNDNNEQILSDEELSSNSGKRSVATATADDMLLINNSNSSSATASFMELTAPHLQNHTQPRWPSPIDPLNSNLLSSYGSHPFYGPMGGYVSENGTPTQSGLMSHQLQTSSHVNQNATSFQSSAYQSSEDEPVRRTGSAQGLSTSHNRSSAGNITGGDMSGLLNESSEDVPIGIPTTKGKGKGNRKSRIADNGQSFAEMRRKFHCSHCGKSFKTKSHLQRHILTHTGEKPYVCNKCGSKFNQSSSLRNHVIAIHTKDYPHFCDICQKGFLMPALLQRHLANSHQDGATGGGGDDEDDQGIEE